MMCFDQSDHKFAEWDWKEVQQLKDTIYGVQQHVRDQGKMLQGLSERLGIMESQMHNVQMDLRSFISASMSQGRQVSILQMMHEHY